MSVNYDTSNIRVQQFYLHHCLHFPSPIPLRLQFRTLSFGLVQLDDVHVVDQLTLSFSSVVPTAIELKIGIIFVACCRLLTLTSLSSSDVGGDSSSLSDWLRLAARRAGGRPRPPTRKDLFFPVSESEPPDGLYFWLAIKREFKCNQFQTFFKWNSSHIWATIRIVTVLSTSRCFRSNILFLFFGTRIVYIRWNIYKRKSNAIGINGWCSWWWEEEIKSTNIWKMYHTRSYPLIANKLYNQI